MNPDNFVLIGQHNNTNPFAIDLSCSSRDASIWDTDTVSTR